jgi:hypothetical protein
MMARCLVMLMCVEALSACAGEPHSSARFPVRPPGCPVQIFPDTPPMKTENIGSVHASCAPEVSRDECVRELKDQACHLGGDVLWGVPDEPRVVDEKNQWNGRVAHTK